ncbi:hypothetical protein STEG23_002146, partial [Scotinomys teguina]
MGRRQCKSTYNIIKNKTTPESSPPPTPRSDHCNADKAEENDLKKSLMKMLEEAFEEKMKNVSKEIGENTNKKLEEINKEIEEKKSKKLEEMNNEIEEKKNKRVEEMNKEIEEKRNKKLQELDKEMEEKINKKLKEMNKEIEEKTNKKLEEINKGLKYIISYVIDFRVTHELSDVILMCFLLPVTATPAYDLPLGVVATMNYNKGYPGDQEHGLDLSLATSPTYAFTSITAPHSIWMEAKDFSCLHGVQLIDPQRNSYTKSSRNMVEEEVGKLCQNTKGQRLLFTEDQCKQGAVCTAHRTNSLNKDAATDGKECPWERNLQGNPSALARKGSGFEKLANPQRLPHDEHSGTL